ncbi:MAG: FecR domain-containing protein [Acidobacteriota bacterium]|nr:MAG: FecR domain-containing protein [Acidobacteriota bacterium]
MKRTERELNELLDETTAQIRNEKLDGAVVEGASQRVWKRIAGEQAAAEAGITPVDQIRNCEDFQALIPAYLQGYLSSARTMLLEDHTRECVPCRKALKEARNGNQAARQLEVQRARMATSAFRSTVLRWGVAAVLAVSVGLIAWPWVQRFTNSVSTLNAIVEASNGNLYKVTDNRTAPIKVGDRLDRGERVRTARNATAVIRLADGSLVEMNERSEFSVTDNGSGSTINLERGKIIVQAAKQGERKLFVATEDALISVTGTIFSVNNGTKGSRISVIEGEVRVDQSGRERVLRPGDQVTTHESIERVAVQDEVRWSRDSEKYKNLLAAAEAVRSEVNARLTMPGNRYSTRLLDLMPEETAFFVALPNISATLADANRILQDNLHQSPELREWWTDERGRAQNGRGINEAIDFISEFGSYLGDEIVIGAAIRRQGASPEEPVIMAEVRDPAGMKAFIENKLGGLGEARNKVHLVADPLSASAAAGDDQFYIWMENDLLAASPKLDSLKSMATRVRTRSLGRFAATPFRAHVAGLYREGAGLLIAADLEKIFTSEMRQDKDAAVAQRLGLTNLRYFAVEVKQKGGKPYNRAVVNFQENQRGFTSWLAAPGPMGALEFISPDANIVAAFVVKEPTALVDDLFSTLQTADPEAWQQLQNVQAQEGIDLREDIAAPMGSEYAFALDGPVLPMPSWKAVFEVDDPAHLQQTLETAIERVNQKMAEHGKKGLAWSNQASGDYTFYTLKSLDIGLEVNYTYAYGYLVAAPSRTLVENAIKYRESGYSLLQSSKFRASLPEDKQANFSAMVYQNIGPLVKPLRGVSRGMTSNAPKGARQAIEALMTDKAGLAYVYALNDRFVFSVNTEEGALGLSPADFLGLPGSSGLGGLLKGAGR